ncbi:MAG TPA: hypothetical protein PKD54_05385 [Pirellulaceae bacterium]|nr:hypothetical protein [Pirellulaceae bacterium]
MSIGMSAPQHQRPPVRLRMRSDLNCTRMEYQGVEYWVIKEPLAQKYYQFPPHVYFLLQQLDGQRSVQEILDNYHREHAPKRITPEEFQQLVQRFHKDNLIVGDAVNQGVELFKRGWKTWWMERLMQFSNILALRFRGVDPDRLLNPLERWFGWLFSPAAAMAVGILALVALSSVLIHWNEFRANLPGFDDFFSPQRWYLFAIVLGVTKVLHELGHGITCKRFGGECHEIGFMLLVLTPCLYCNVSDSWRLTNKWKRAAIGAAGMYVELMLATAATFAWWFVQPGLVQDICLQIMLICSISTLLFNGNPLLRFDGYYILSDLLEIPNLHQRSGQALNTLLGRKWLGLEMPSDPLLPRNRLGAFAAFIVASYLYRGFVLFSILLFLTRWLEPHGLESVGKSIAWVAAAGIIGWPTYRLYRFFSVPGRVMQIKPKRFAVVTLISAVVLVAIFGTPWPHRVRARAVVLPERMETVYAREPGVIREILVEPGQWVEAGQVVARLENMNLALEIAETLRELESARAKRAFLAQASATSIAKQLEYLQPLASLDAEILKYERVLATLQSRDDLLVLRAPISGFVVAPPFREQVPGELETPMVDRLPLLTGGQHHLTLRPGQRLCEIADWSQWQAVILLTETNIDWVRPGQSIKLKLHAFPGEVIESTIKAVGVSDRLVQRQKRADTPESLQARIRVPDLLGELVPQHDQQSIQYLAKASLPTSIPAVAADKLETTSPIAQTSAVAHETRAEYFVGLDAQARIHIGYRNLASRVWRWFNETFGG